MVMNYPGVLVFIGAGANASLDLPTTPQFLELVRKDTIKISEKSLFYKLEALDYVKDIEQVWYLLHLLENTDKEFMESKFLREYAFFNIDVSWENWDTFMDRIKSLKSDIEEGMFSAYSLDPNKEGAALNLYKPLIYFVADLNISENKKHPKTEIPIFTTNYDRVIDDIYENYFYDERFNFLDGFRDRDIRRTIDLRSLKEKRERPTIRLFQLHGSLRWRRGFITERRKKEKTIVKISDESAPSVSSKYKEPILIYPGSKIVDNIDPFNKLYDLFEEYLNEAHCCIVIGCSFRDAKINELLLGALESNGNLELIIISPDAEQTIAEAEKRDFKGIKKFENRLHYPDGKKFEEVDLLELKKLVNVPFKPYFSKNIIRELEGPYKHGNYTLYTREVMLKSRKKHRIYFFSQKEEKSGTPCELPKGYEMKVSKTGLPYLRKK